MKNKALKLFVLVDSSGATVKNDDGGPLYFNDKMAARAHRRVLDGEKQRHHISPGPDHHKLNGGVKT